MPTGRARWPPSTRRAASPSTRTASLFVADTGNNAIRRIGADGVVSTVFAPLEGERQPVLRRPTGLALTHDGYLYIAGGGGRIVQLAPERRDPRARRRRPSAGVDLRRRRQGAPVRAARRRRRTRRRHGRGRCAGAARAAPGAAEAGRGGAGLAGADAGQAHRTDALAGRAAGHAARSRRPDGRSARQLRRREPRPLPRRPRRARRHRHARAGDRAEQSRRPVRELGFRDRSAKASPSGRCRTSTCASGAMAATNRSMHASSC